MHSQYTCNMIAESESERGREMQRCHMPPDRHLLIVSSHFITTSRLFYITWRADGRLDFGGLRHGWLWLWRWLWPLSCSALSDRQGEGQRHGLFLKNANKKGGVICRSTRPLHTWELKASGELLP